MNLPTTYPSFSSFIDHHPDVGGEAMSIFGLPGSGKTCIANSLGTWALDRNNIIVMRGSKSCEWRHFYKYEACKKITVFIPIQLKPENKEDRPIIFKRIPPKYFKDFVYVDFEKLNLEEHVRGGEVFVLYDHCFNVAQRTWVIVDQLKNLANRSHNDYSDDLDEIPVVYIEHESQVVFPMTPLSPKKTGLSNKQWHAVNQMQHLSVDFRKDLVKPIYVAQLTSQFNALLRDLCCFKVFKKGSAGSHAPEPIRRSTPFLEINQCNIMVGEGLYLQRVPVAKFVEIKEKWKMIPKKMIDYKCAEERRQGSKDKGTNKFKDQRDIAIRMLIDRGITQEYIGEELTLSQQHVSRIGASE